MKPTWAAATCLLAACATCLLLLIYVQDHPWCHILQSHKLSITQNASAQRQNSTNVPGRDGEAPLSPSVLPHDCAGHDIPVVLLAFNNPTLLRLSVRQLRECFNATVIILDMGSTYSGMLAYLREVTRDPRVTVMHAARNNGPHTLFTPHGHDVWQRLPRFFAFSDADLRLGDWTPRNFRCVLAHLTQRLSVPKAGLALDVSSPGRMWGTQGYSCYHGHTSCTIADWERHLYAKRVAVPGWSLLDDTVFEADIDTTFAVHDKSAFACSASKDCFTYMGVRVAGLFAALHRPWHPEAFKHIPADEVAAMFSGSGSTVADLVRTGAIELKKAREYKPGFWEPRDLMSFTCKGQAITLEVPPGGTPLSGG
jgi:hypothetical protein